MSFFTTDFHRIDHIGIMFFRLLYFFAIAVSMFMYHHLFEKKNILKFGNFFALGGIVACIMLILTLIDSPFMIEESPRSFIEGQTFFGLLIGIGLGIGFDIADMITRNSRNLTIK